MTESVSITAETPLLQTSSSELGTTVGDERIEALPLSGRNFVNLTRTVPGVLRGIPGSNIDGAGSLAWRASASFSANGQRARQQLHARRRRQQRDLAADGRDLPERRIRRVQAADVDLLRGVRPVARRRRQPADQVGDQRLPRQRFQVPPQRRVRRQQLLQQQEQPPEAGVQAEPVRRHARRAGFKDKTFFFGSYRERESQGRRSCRRSPRWRCAMAISRRSHG